MQLPALILRANAFLYVAKLITAALAATGLSDEMRLAMYRVHEVMSGSTVALLQTLVYGYVLERWRA